MIDIANFKDGLMNLTTTEEIYIYTAEQLYIPSVYVVFGITLCFMLLLGLAMISKDNKSSYFAVFVLSTLIMGILLFFTFWYPIIPLFLDNILNGGF